MIESFLLYGGDVELSFNPGNHQYRIILTKSGRKFKPDSVTRICGIIDKSAALLGWHGNNIIDFLRAGIQPGVEHAESYLEEVYAQAKKESQRKKSEAAQKGTEVHHILQVNQGGYNESLQLDPSVAFRVQHGLTWLKENNVELIYIERPIYSRRYRYSGRLDGVVRIGGALSLLDYKTGKNIYPEHRLQTAAYVHALEEELGVQIIQRIILHLGEEACTPHYYGRELLRGDFAAFLGAQRLHQQIKKIEKEEKK